MKHYEEGDLALYYYGESPDAATVARHLAECRACASAYEAMSGMLQGMTLPSSEPTEEIRRDIHDLVRRRLLERRQPWWALTPGAGLLAVLVWMVPVLYPFSFGAVFSAAHVARAHPVAGLPLLVLALAWALAGPIVAVYAMSRLDPYARGGQRLAVSGALVAAITPALFNLTSRSGWGLTLWYGAMLLGAASAALPRLDSVTSQERLRSLHRVSGTVVLLFALVHIANQGFAFVSVDVHTSVQSLLRTVYRNPAVEALLLASVALQIATGLTIWRARLPAVSLSANLQALSGLYLAAFFLAHVSAVLVARTQHSETDFTWAAGMSGLLASPRLTSLLPYYLFGIVALLVHAGAYARLRSATVLSDRLVRRLSYAAVACSGAAIVVIAMALCGYHVAP
jgi:hypothetical protein